MTDNNTGALRGLRVLDLSRVLAGPYCAQMLADHGATVLKVEGPSGDDTRAWGPPFIERDVSSYYFGINRSKSNIGLDLSTARGQEILARLMSEADIVIENFKVGTLARWGLDYETVLADRHPGLIYCRISGYGADGPMGGLPGYDSVLQAFGGLMSINGMPDEPPLRVGVPIVDIMAAQLAFGGILLALQEKHRSGLGQFVDTTLLDSVVSMLHPHSSAWLENGAVPLRTGHLHPTVAPYQVFQTATGPYFISAPNERQFASLMQVLGCPDMAKDARFANNASRYKNLGDLEEMLSELICLWDGEELSRQLIGQGVPASAVNTVDAALKSPQVQHRKLVIEEPGYRGIGVPIKLSRSGSTPVQRPRPRGADTFSVLEGLGFSPTEIRSLASDGVVFQPTKRVDEDVLPEEILADFATQP